MYYNNCDEKDIYIYPYIIYANAYICIYNICILYMQMHIFCSNAVDYGPQILFHLCRNFSKLSIKYQSHPKVNKNQSIRTKNTHVSQVHNPSNKCASQLT